MRILVIGGTGFVGLCVVRQLHEAGHRVVVFHRGKTTADLPADVDQLHGDRAQIAEFAVDFRRLAPDVALDMVPMTERDARSVVDSFRGVASRLVAISSADVYRAWGRLLGTEPGSPEPVPLTEDAPLRERLYPYRGRTPRSADAARRPLDDYDKIPVEQVVLADPTLPGTVLRLPLVYGPRDGQHRLFPLLKRFDDGRPAILLERGLARWRGSRGYVENIAAAIALAATDDRSAGRVYNVAEPDAPTEAEWARLVGQAAGWDGEIVALPRDRLPEALVPRFDTAQPMVTDTRRIRHELGYAEPVPRDEALRRTVAWQRAHPPAGVDPAAFDYVAEDIAFGRTARRGDA